MRKAERYNVIFKLFSEKMPHADTELEFGSVFQLLVAVVLSAQCTDKRVNLVTPELFRHYPDAAHMAEAEAEDILSFIKSVSYPNAKAAHLAELSRLLIERHHGEVPDSMEALTSLPGVGRKTANVIMAIAFGHPTMAVDTHVFRVSHRLRLVSATAKTPLSVEQELLKHIPATYLSRAHHWLLLHGRYVCTSRRPHCDECFLHPYCPSASEKINPQEPSRAFPIKEEARSKRKPLEKASKK